MKIHLLAIGKQIPEWAEHGIESYVKRFHMIQFTSTVLDEKVTKHMTEQQVMVKENQKLLSHIPDNTFVIALDKRGQLWNTEQLTKNLSEQNQKITLVIGGTTGLNESLLKRADKIWSLSNLVLPHALARVVVVEQLYRSQSILTNHPYHRA